MLEQIPVVVTTVRKCGRRVVHGLYAAGGTEVSEEGILSRFTLLNPPIPYQVAHHRGPRFVDGWAVLGRQPMAEWWIGTSRKTEERKRGDQWALDTFGMLPAVRLKTGTTEGAESVDAAVRILLSNLTWDSRVLDVFRDMSLANLQDLPKLAGDYHRLHQAMLDYTISKQPGHLLAAAAATWRMAYNLSPSKRALGIPHLMRTLALLGLARDAAAMRRMFPLPAG